MVQMNIYNWWTYVTQSCSTCAMEVIKSTTWNKRLIQFLFDFVWQNEHNPTKKFSFIKWLFFDLIIHTKELFLISLPFWKNIMLAICLLEYMTRVWIFSCFLILKQLNVHSSDCWKALMFVVIETLIFGSGSEQELYK